MKNILKKIILIFLVVFACKIADVNAALAGGPHEYYEFGNDYILIDKTELNTKNSDDSYKYDGNYIIGTHMFTYEGSEKYNGILKTKHIMLASQTIGKYSTPSLDDMKVYYVDGNKLTDAFSGIEYENYGTLYIDNINLEKVDLGFTDLDMDVPELYLDSNDGVGSIAGGASDYIMLSSTEVEGADFYKLFVAEAEDGLYMTDSNKIAINYIDHIIYNVPYGTTLYFKIKACNEEKEMCSDWSNVVSYTANVPTPESPFGYMGSGGYEGEDLVLDAIHYAYGIDGIELYSSNNPYSGYKKILTKEKETKITPERYVLYHLEGSYSGEEDNYYWFGDEEYIETYYSLSELQNSPYYSPDLKMCDDIHTEFSGNCFRHYEEEENEIIEFNLLTKKDEVKYYKAKYYVIDSKGNKHYSQMSSYDFLINPVTIDDNLGTPSIEYAYSSSDEYGYEIRTYQTDEKYEFVKVYIQEIGTDEPAIDMTVPCNNGMFEIPAYNIPTHAYISIRGIDAKDGKTTMSSLSEAYEEHLNIAD